MSLDDHSTIPVNLFSVDKSQPWKNRIEKVSACLNLKRVLYIFGAKLNGEKCIDYCNKLGITIKGFIDNDPMKIGQIFHGFEILSLASIDKNSIILNSSGRYVNEINLQLEVNNFFKIITFTELLYLFNLQHQAEDKIQNFTNEILVNASKINSLFLSLGDDLSRKTLNAVVDFRLTLDSKPLSEITPPYDEEFFPRDLLAFDSNGVFIDGGAYDGDSYLKYLSRKPKNPKAYLFEPDEQLCKKASERLNNNINFRIFNACLYSSDGYITFSTTGGMNGSISELGNLKVKTMMIDNISSEKVGHIKLDVEGAEEKVLIGAKKKLMEDKPTLAIACYHKPNDIWQIPELIQILTKNSYHFYLRHYSQTLDDTILYAIPDHLHKP